MTSPTKSHSPSSRPKHPRAPSGAPSFPQIAPGAHTLESLREAVGAPNETLRQLLFRHAAEDDLAADGAQIDSDNITADIPRFVASCLTILQSLDDARRGLFKLPAGIFAVLVDETLTLQTMKREHDAALAVGASDKVDREALLRKEMRAGVAQRELVLGGLRHALSEDQARRAAALAGDAASPEKLAAGLTALADFIDSILASNAEDDIAALELFDVSGASAEALREKAVRVREAGTVVAVYGRRVSQRALDVQDGRVLLLVDVILRAFKLAQRADRSILLPELSKIAWMFFDPRGNAAKPKAPAGEGAAPPPAQDPSGGSGPSAGNG